MGTLTLSREAKYKRLASKIEFSKLETKKKEKKLSPEKQAQRELKEIRTKEASEWFMINFQHLINPPRPWAIGLAKVICKMRPEGISKSALNRAMQTYLKSEAYKQVRVIGAARIGIDGKPDDTFVETVPDDF